MRPSLVPSMAEILNKPRSGLVGAVLFGGGGGTDLGLEWAGVEVRFFNDSDRHAVSCYRDNHPLVHIDGRSVRDVKPHDILGAIGKRPDILAASPPCVAFSPAGRRHRKLGRVVDHAGATDVNIAELAFEAVRLVDGVRPNAVLIENVPEWRTGRGRGTFQESMRRLLHMGYRVGWRVLDAWDFGVPQRRKRLIVIGLAGHLGLEPRFPDPSGRRYAIKDVLDDVDHVDVWNYGPKYYRADEPAPTITASTQQSITWRAADRSVVAFKDFVDLKRLCGFPDDFDLTASSHAQAKARLGNSVVPPMAYAIASVVRDQLLNNRQDK